MRSERLRRGWSQTRLSGLTGIVATDLGAIERGTKYPFAGWRRRIAAAFKLRETELFAEVPGDEPRPR